MVLALKMLTLSKQLYTQEDTSPLCHLLSVPPPNLLSLLVSSSPAPELLRVPSRFPSCSEKSILGGGLKDLSQEYYSTAQCSDKPPVTSSRDGAGQARAPHLGGKVFSPGCREERHKEQDVDLLVYWCGLLVTLEPLTCD